MGRVYKQKTDTQFEIRFYEGIIAKQPDFIEALIALGDLYTKQGLYAQGLDIDERLAALRPEDPLIFYNLACSYSLLNRIEEALVSIKKAFAFGYEDISFLNQDSDLVHLRNDARFQQFVSRLKIDKENKT